MSFDKELFLRYIKEEMNNDDNSKNFASRFYRLYKTYSLINLILEKKGKNEIEKLEDSIYTVDNVVLSDKERILLELSSIKEIARNHDNKKLKNEISLQIDKLENELQDLDLTDKSVLHYFKKNISVLQASLGIDNTFLQAAFDAFLELYRNKCINNLANNHNFNKSNSDKNIYKEELNFEIFEKITR